MRYAQKMSQVTPGAGCAAARLQSRRVKPPPLAIVELNSFMDRINATLHPDDNAPSAPSGCDLVTYVKELREERCYFGMAIYHLPRLLGREITDDYTGPVLA